ncbi:hypothetical protein SALBM135S_05366 [Streptomyces alboniger]
MGRQAERLPGLARAAIRGACGGGDGSAPGRTVRPRRRWTGSGHRGSTDLGVRERTEAYRRVGRTRRADQGGGRLPRTRRPRPPDHDGGGRGPPRRRAPRSPCTWNWARPAMDVLDLLCARSAVPPHKVILGHLNRSPDFTVHRQAAEAGAYLAFDGPSRAHHATDWRMPDDRCARWSTRASATTSSSARDTTTAARDRGTRRSRHAASAARGAPPPRTGRGRGAGATNPDDQSVAGLRSEVGVANSLRGEVGVANSLRGEVGSANSLRDEVGVANKGSRRRRPPPVLH